MGQENDRLVKQMEEERGVMNDRLARLREQNERLTKESVALRGKFTNNLLTLKSYQQQLILLNKNNEANDAPLSDRASMTDADGAVNAAIDRSANMHTGGASPSRGNVDKSPLQKETPSKSSSNSSDDKRYISANNQSADVLSHSKSVSTSPVLKLKSSSNSKSPSRSSSRAGSPSKKSDLDYNSLKLQVELLKLQLEEQKKDQNVLQVKLQEAIAASRVAASREGEGPGNKMTPHSKHLRRLLKIQENEWSPTNKINTPDLKGGRRSISSYLKQRELEQRLLQNGNLMKELNDSLDNDEEGESEINEDEGLVNGKGSPLSPGLRNSDGDGDGGRRGRGRGREGPPLPSKGQTQDIDISNTEKFARAVLLGARNQKRRRKKYLQQSSNKNTNSNSNAYLSKPRSKNISGSETREMQKMEDENEYSFFKHNKQFSREGPHRRTEVNNIAVDDLTGNHFEMSLFDLLDDLEGEKCVPVPSRYLQEHKDSKCEGKDEYEAFSEEGSSDFGEEEEEEGINLTTHDQSRVNYRKKSSNQPRKYFERVAAGLN